MTGLPRSSAVFPRLLHTTVTNRLHPSTIDPMGSARGPTPLPVIMPRIPGQRWSCHSCGNCCRSLTGHLTEDDRRRIDAHDWHAELGVPPYVPLGRGFVLNKTAEDACVFLDAENRCRIHSRFGEAAKPVACRIFPFSVRRTSASWQGSLRFDCPSITGNRGALIEENRSWLGGLVDEIQSEIPPSDIVELQTGLRASPDEETAFLKRLTQWLDGVGPAAELPLMERIRGAAHLSSLLAGARFDRVRGQRFEELLDILFTNLPQELTIPLPPPSSRQVGLFRQCVLVHTEHATLAEARAGFGGRTRMKLAQLVRARSMRRGRGTAPPLRGFTLPHRPQFTAIECVRPNQSDTYSVTDLIRRYIAARIEGRSVYGAGYYAWPLFVGFCALWLGIAAVGWLARYRAAGQNRGEISFDDVASALGVVDRAATRLPSVGSLAERLRTTYLTHDDGIVRLVSAFECVAGNDLSEA